LFPLLILPSRKREKRRVARMAKITDDGWAPADDPMLARTTAEVS
jgi:hypothetical protein